MRRRCRARRATTTWEPDWHERYVVFSTDGRLLGRVHLPRADTCRCASPSTMAGTAAATRWASAIRSRSPHGSTRSATASAATTACACALPSSPRTAASARAARPSARRSFRSRTTHSARTAAARSATRTTSTTRAIPSCATSARAHGQAHTLPHHARRRHHHGVRFRLPEQLVRPVGRHLPDDDVMTRRHQISGAVHGLEQRVSLLDALATFTINGATQTNTSAARSPPAGSPTSSSSAPTSSPPPRTGFSPWPGTSCSRWSAVKSFSERRLDLTGVVSDRLSGSGRQAAARSARARGPCGRRSHR